MDAALNFINSRWNNGPSGTWYGNLNHPYAMWAVYKGLDEYGFLNQYGSGPGENFFIGTGPWITNAPGGYLIGQDWWDGLGGNPAPVLSQPGDWYSHYCDYLVSIQNSTNGSWAGYDYWTGAMATGWYINILNATGTSAAVIPEPATMLLLGSGLAGLGAFRRRLRKK